ncbi:MAG: transposase, partial [Oscillospiraceae bacterium]|nr:transposase [Oscillospiraceae bacterium]
MSSGSWNKCCSIPQLSVKNQLKLQAKAEKHNYSKLKKARWTLLMRHEKLSEDRSTHLNTILETHHDLAICYAMKEEMCRLFSLT